VKDLGKWDKRGEEDIKKISNFLRVPKNN